jgi:hypothetical protein
MTDAHLSEHHRRMLFEESGISPEVAEARGYRTVEKKAEQALTFSTFAPSARARPALVNGAAGVVSWSADGRPLSVMGFTVRHGKIVEIDILADPARLSQLDLALLDD